jgi:hypothetical protein
MLLVGVIVLHYRHHATSAGHRCSGYHGTFSCPDSSLSGHEPAGGAIDSGRLAMGSSLMGILWGRLLFSFIAIFLLVKVMKRWVITSRNCK